jgi:hypothetical protein
MTGQLHELLKASQALRDALVTRDADAIQAAVSRQEKSAEACMKAHATRPEGGDTARGGVAEDRALAEGIRRIQQTNRRVAGGFLSVIDRTLASLGAGTLRHPVTYGADGWSRPSSAPVLVHQLG